AFRPHVMDMFEPQDHPDNFPVPGGPPMRPYDNAGWTLAYQMGIEFDRILDSFTGPFEAIPDWNLKPPAGQFQPQPVSGGYGYTGSLRQLDSFVAANRLLAAGVPVMRQPDAFWTPAVAASTPIVQKVAAERGVNFVRNSPDPAPGAVLAKRRIGLWDQ